MAFPKPYILSIETDNGTYHHGHHLGTIESIARELAQEAYHHMVPRIGHHIVTVALLRANKLLDVYDGEWNSERYDEYEPLDLTVLARQLAN